jgi:hypothetical protein
VSSIRAARGQPSQHDGGGASRMADTARRGCEPSVDQAAKQAAVFTVATRLLRSR